MLLASSSQITMRAHTQEHAGRSKHCYTTCWNVRNWQPTVTPMTRMDSYAGNREDKVPNCRGDRIYSRIRWSAGVRIMKHFFNKGIIKLKMTHLPMIRCKTGDRVAWSILLPETMRTGAMRGIGARLRVDTALGCFEILGMTTSCTTRYDRGRRAVHRFKRLASEAACQSVGFGAPSSTAITQS